MKISAASAQDYAHVHAWMILFGATLFALFVAWDMRFIQSMLAIDASYLSGLTLVIFFGASAHCFWHVVQTSRGIAAAQSALEGGGAGQSALVAAFLSETAMAGRPHAASDGEREAENWKTSGLIEIYADKLRAPTEIGWFIVDLLIRLGLLGTIIGFIIILVSLTNGPIPGAGEIQKLLVTMGGGMGTALYTTFAGLVGATLLAMQYIILGRSVESLLASLIRIAQRGGATQAAGDGVAAFAAERNGGAQPERRPWP